MRAHPAGPRHGEQVAAHAAPLAPVDPAALHALDPAVWPRSAARDAGRQPGAEAMTVGGIDVRELAGTYGTPLLVLDEADFRARAAAFVAAFDSPPRCDVLLRRQGVPVTTVVRAGSSEEGLGLDVCTGGELAVALARRLPGRADRVPRQQQVGRASSPRRSTRASAASSSTRSRRSSGSRRSRAERGVRARVLVRVTVGVEAHTHEFIATAHEDQKFGFSLAAGARAEAVRRVARAARAASWSGLHSHIGSQIFDAAGFEVAAHRLVGLARPGPRRARRSSSPSSTSAAGSASRTPATTTRSTRVDRRDAARHRRQGVRRARARRAAARRRTGPRIVGPAMVTLYEVGTVKAVELGRWPHPGVRQRRRRHERQHPDGAVRRRLHGGARRRGSRPPPPMLARVVGKHCESGDVVVRDAWLPGTSRPATSWPSPRPARTAEPWPRNYNHLPRPAVVAVRDGHARVCFAGRRRGPARARRRADRAVPGAR